MTGRVTHIWRHPIKSHGREALQSVALTAGQTMPWDRHWAVAHTQSKADNSAWAKCANFTRVAKASSLQAVSAELNEDTLEITLRHPDADDVTFSPNDDETMFMEWANQFVPDDRAQSARLVKVPERGMTDTDFPSISLNSHASHKAVTEKVDGNIDIERWRGNIWFDGVPAWEEFSWAGKNVRIGTAELGFREPIGRCTATMASAATGKRDCDMLEILHTNWGHKNFGVYCEVVRSGQVNVGDELAVLS